MGLLRGVARTAVVAGTASAVSGRVQRRQQQRWNAQESQQQAGSYEEQPVYQAAPAPESADPLEQLKTLGELKAQGVLTEEEFATQKAKILGA
ncbi:SHOCT domain-containing protein [Diaminobutyricimonas sp. TR449]|uniref:SHOCT domain-containing protein n=1 Tax=Diaminobutyricimonas sp. TR449 TaxID=2708076 RepID=UPI00141E0A69|nr:SHOCT domain-containing protein [Diaminobutyricimonas sp. TR449]